MSPRRRWAFRALALALSATFALVLAETVLECLAPRARPEPPARAIRLRELAPNTDIIVRPPADVLAESDGLTDRPCRLRTDAALRKKWRAEPLRPLSERDAFAHTLLNGLVFARAAGVEIDVEPILRLAQKVLDS